MNAWEAVGGPLKTSDTGARFRRSTGAWALAAVLLAGTPASAGDAWLGAGAGYVKPEGVNATVGFAGELRLELGRNLALQPEIDYWKRTETVTGLTVSASDLAFGVTALLLLPASPVVFFVGAGPAVHRLGGDMDYYGFAVSSDSVTRIGVGVLGGLDVEFSRSLRFFVAARYGWVPLETEVPDSVNQGRLYGGFRLRL